MESSLHGKKRTANDTTLEAEQRLAKRLSLLKLDRTGRATGSATSPVPTSKKSKQDTVGKTAPDGGEWMQVDETRDRIYITSLEDEASDDSGDEPLVFLPDIEKRLTRIPPVLLQPQPAAPAGPHELVLYQIPSSLSVPAEEDSVRRAIIETRARAMTRGREAGAAGSAGGVADSSATAADETTDDDPDAMDLG